jgi:hypothetical protein
VNLVQREDGSFVDENILRQQERDAFLEAAREREEKARRRKKAKNETMYTIAISDYHEVRKKPMYDQRRTSRNQCFGLRSSNSSYPKSMTPFQPKCVP